MGDLEKVGLLKMDFLGLRTLTLLDNAVRLIEKTRGIKIDISKLPLDDPETYDLLQRGDAKGVFQLESDGIRELLKRMKPDNIRDIIAMHGTLPARPARRRHGRCLRQLQARPGKAALCPSGHGGSAQRNARRDGVSRTDHADPQPAGRHRAVQRLCLHQGDQQEEARHHRPAAGGVHQGRPGARPGRRHGPGHLRTDRRLRRLRLQQSPQRRLRPGRLPDRLPENPLPPEFMAALLSSEIEDGNKRDIMVEHIDDARRLGVEVLPPRRQQRASPNSRCSRARSSLA